MLSAEFDCVGEIFCLIAQDIFCEEGGEHNHSAKNRDKTSMPYAPPANAPLQASGHHRSSSLTLIARIVS
jgi:hypothetical protein